MDQLLYGSVNSRAYVLTKLRLLLEQCYLLKEQECVWAQNSAKNRCKKCKWKVGLHERAVTCGLILISPASPAKDATLISWYEYWGGGGVVGGAWDRTDGPTCLSLSGDDN